MIQATIPFCPIHPCPTKHMLINSTCRTDQRGLGAKAVASDNGSVMPVKCSFHHISAAHCNAVPSFTSTIAATLSQT